MLALVKHSYLLGLVRKALILSTSWMITKTHFLTYQNTNRIPFQDFSNEAQFCLQTSSSRGEQLSWLVSKSDTADTAGNSTVWEQISCTAGYWVVFLTRIGIWFFSNCTHPPRKRITWQVRTPVSLRNSFSEARGLRNGIDVMTKIQLNFYSQIRGDFAST